MQTRTQGGLLEICLQGDYFLSFFLMMQDSFHRLANLGCWVTLARRSIYTIRAESVGPLRRISQRFSPLPISNVDPHHTGTDALLSATLRQGVGRGNSILRRESGITIPSHNGQKTSSKCCKWMNGAK